MLYLNYLLVIPAVFAIADLSPPQARSFGSPPSSDCNSISKRDAVLNKTTASLEIDRIFERYSSLAVPQVVKRDASFSLGSLGGFAAQAAILEAGLVAYRQAQLLQAASDALSGASTKGAPIYGVSSIPVTNSGSLDLIDTIVGGLDTAYSGTVIVGSAAQKVLVTFDTGSSDVWLSTSGNCPGGCFIPSSSTTFRDTKTPLTLQFVQGKVSGSIANDIFSIGGLEITQTFLAASSKDNSFNGFPAAGLVGLGPASGSKTKAPTLFDSIVAANHLAAPLFGLFLSRGGSGSSLAIGTPDKNHYTGSISYFPVSGNSYWQIQAASIHPSSGASTQMISNMVVVDSGTTNIIVPRALAHTIYNSIPTARYDSFDVDSHADYYSYDCSKPPTVSLSFVTFPNSVQPTNSFSISPKDFKIGTVDGSSSLCYGAIVGGDTPGDVIILGETFLKNYYSVFTKEGPTGVLSVGFAASK